VSAKPYVIRITRPGSLLSIVFEAEITEIEAGKIIELVAQHVDPPLPDMETLDENMARAMHGDR
jgi:hypothetical protein